MRALAQARRARLRGRTVARLGGLFLGLSMLSACGGGGGSSGDSTHSPSGGPDANVQPYSVHWQQPQGGPIDRYELSVGDRSESSDYRIEFQAGLATVRPDGTFTFEIELDRSRDRFLKLRAGNSRRWSPRSNELLVPSLGAASAVTAAAQSTSQEARTASPSSRGAAITLEIARSSSGTDSRASEQAPPAEPTRDPTQALSPPIDDPLRSLHLNGVDQFLASTDATTLAPGARLTLSLWAKKSGPAVGRESLFGLSCTIGSCGVELVLDDTPGETLGAALELWRTDVSGVRTLLGRMPMPRSTDDWWHVAAVFDADAGRTRFYLDGDLVAVESSPAAPLELGTGGPMRIALGSAGDGGASPWSGQLGHVALFDRALDEAELEALALGGHELDLRETTDGVLPAHYWRLGASAAAVGRDSGLLPLDLDAPAGPVGPADIANDAPRAREAGDDPGTQ